MTLISPGSVVLSSTLHYVWCWQVMVLQPAPAPFSKLKPGEKLSGPTDERLNIIYPGTKWCGSGSVAADYNDLGELEATDACCREHDYCPDLLEAGQSGYNLTNHALYTKLHCDCDHKFLECLKTDGSYNSYLIGIMYFNVLNTQCFRDDHPIIKCASYYTRMPQRCQVYELDTTAPKLYQFFDVPMI